MLELQFEGDFVSLSKANLKAFCFLWYEREQADKK